MTARGPFSGAVRLYRGSASLRTQITVGYGLLIAVCLCAYSVVAGLSFGRHAGAALDHRAHEAIELAARALVLTDHNSGIDALVQRTRARGIVQGGMEHGCRMKYLRRTEDVAVGDRVVTSGMDGIFPKGILIGEVTDISRGHRGLLQMATVTPSASLETIEEVLIVSAAAPTEDGG